MDFTWEKYDICVSGNNPGSITHGTKQSTLCSVVLCVFEYLGKTLSNIEQFGQYPLQVNGFNNLDECLEGAMVEGEIEALHSDQTITSGREVSNFQVKLIRINK